MWEVSLCVYVCVCRVCASVSVCIWGGGPCRDQKRASDPLELEIQAVVSHLTWVLGIKYSNPLILLSNFAFPISFQRDSDNLIYMSRTERFTLIHSLCT